VERNFVNMTFSRPLFFQPPPGARLNGSSGLRARRQPPR